MHRGGRGVQITQEDVGTVRQLLNNGPTLHPEGAAGVKADW